MKYVGIDLAGSPTHPTGFCLLDDKLDARCKLLYSDDDILDAVRKSGAKIVAVDAPLALPRGVIAQENTAEDARTSESATEYSCG